MSYSPKIRIYLLIYFRLFHIQGWKKWESVVLWFIVVEAVNKCLFIIVKRGTLDNFLTTVHTDYICKIGYIAQIGNPFIHFVIQYIFCHWTLANSLWYYPAKSVDCSCPTTWPYDEKAFSMWWFTLSHEGLQAFTVSVYSYCTLYKYVI